MYISKLKLKNWRNFRDIEVELQDRTFIVGPNASGKSNLLDALRFLRDIVKVGGGLQDAVKQRGGVSKIRSLSAKKNPIIEITVDISDDFNKQNIWTYELGFTQRGGGFSDNKAVVKYERVVHKTKNLITRPTTEDQQDDVLLEYTHLEQPTTNNKFRTVVEFFESLQYLHLIPQLVRDPSSFNTFSKGEDFFGRDFLDRVNRTPKNVSASYLRKIGQVLKIAVPQLKEFEFKIDNQNKPHLEVTYEHWRANGAKQFEDQLSDGTLRLIGLIWALLDGTKPLLLEEPELSLHSAIISQLPLIISRFQKRKGESGKAYNRQIIITTHSFDLLNQKGIGLDEILLLQPEKEGTKRIDISQRHDIALLLQSGLTVADVILPLTKPTNVEQLSLLDLT